LAWRIGVGHPALVSCIKEIEPVCMEAFFKKVDIILEFLIIYLAISKITYSGIADKRG
jgi:hypothetical protein